MLKQRWGRIINIASVFGQMGQAGQANTPHRKRLDRLTMAIARELGSRNILATPSPRLHRNRHDRVLGEEFKQNAAKTDPFGRVGSAAAWQCRRFSRRTRPPTLPTC